VAGEPCWTCEAHAELHGWWDPDFCPVCEEHARMHAEEEGCAGWFFVVAMVGTAMGIRLLKRR